MNRYLCIHAHFYQPPRENPWLEDVELQDSAYPYHDWNERISAECYAPNTASRILGPERRIINIVNNYASISFNVGPTLCSWLERREPEVYAAENAANRERFRTGRSVSESRMAALAALARLGRPEDRAGVEAWKEDADMEFRAVVLDALATWGEAEPAR